MRRYWNCPTEDQRIDKKGAARAFCDIYKTAVLRRLGGRTSVELTGGCDSRLNLAGALACGKDFHAWTIAEDGCGELAIIEKLKKRSDFAHHVFSPSVLLERSFAEDLGRITALTDGESNSLNLIASMAANRASTQLREASISGMGGEILRGFYYITHMGIPNSSPVVYIDRLLSLRMLPKVGLVPQIFSGFFPKNHYDIVRQSIGRYFDHSRGNPLFWRLDDFYLRARQQRFAGRSCSFNSFFYRTEVPFFDNRVIDFAFTIPWKFKKRSLVVRSAIGILSPACAGVELLSGLPARPFRFADSLKALKYYGRFAGKIYRRLQAQLTGQEVRNSDDVGLSGFIRQKLSSQEFLTEFLNYDRMASAFLYEPDAFRQFIVNSVTTGFGNLYQLGLILSFEMTCRHLDNLKAMRSTAEEAGTPAAVKHRTSKERVKVGL